MPETGQLQIRTYISRAVLPLTDSTVAVELEQNGRRSLLALRKTDESGLTPYIAVETPALENSQSPDRPRGWTNVTITVSHSQFERVIIRDVQIFPGIITQQAVEMTPLSQMPDGSDTTQYIIPPQEL